MKKNSSIFLVLAGLVFLITCNQPITNLTQDIAGKLFPVAIELGDTFKEKNLDIRKTTGGQFLINNEGGGADEIILLSHSSGDGDEPSALIIDADVDTATGVVTPISSSISDLGANMYIPAILKLADGTLLSTSIIIRDTIHLLSDQTIQTTGITVKTNSSRIGNAKVLKDAEQEYTHLKTLWTFNNDSLSLFIENPPAVL